MRDSISTNAAPTNVRAFQPRWYQYSLRSLLGVMLFAGLILSWVAWKLHCARVQGGVVAAITALGGKVSYDYMYDSSGSELPPGNQPAATWLRNWLGDDIVSNVYGVEVFGSMLIDKNEDASSQPSATKDEIETVFLNEQQKTFRSIDAAQAVRAIEKLNKLKELRFVDCAITDDDLFHLRDLDAIHKLSLADTQITDDGLVYLKGMKNLRTLILSNTKITDAGLVHLNGLTELQLLWLTGTRVTDEGLAHLRRMVRLRALVLDGTRITDKGIEQLKGLDNLEYLSVHHTRVTRDGIERLELPRLLEGKEVIPPFSHRPNPSIWAEQEKGVRARRRKAGGE